MRAAWPRGGDDGANDLEGVLADALVTAQGWRLSSRSRFVAQAACHGDPCRYSLRGSSSEMAERPISIMSTADDDVDAWEFWLDDVRIATVPALIGKLRQYPAGTRFYFDPIGTLPFPVPQAWTDQGRRRLFDQVRDGAARYGIAVTRECTVARQARARGPITPRASRSRRR